METSAPYNQAGMSGDDHTVVGAIRRRGGNPSSAAVTVTLTVDFLGSGQIGQWLEVMPRVLRAGSNLGFADCLVLAEGEPIARGSATFRVFSSASRDWRRAPLAPRNFCPSPVNIGLL